MMNRNIKRIIWLVVIVIVAWQSVYFKKLSDVKSTGRKFDAAAYAQDMLKNKLPGVAEKAITLDELLTELKASPAETFAANGKALAIGSTRYFLVKGSGEVTKIGESDLMLTTTGKNEVTVVTEFVFGNAIRDASGLVNLNDFTNTVDLSNISSEVNKQIRKNVIPPFKAAVKQGSLVDFVGAVELNQAHLNLDEIEVVPVSLQVKGQN